MRYAHTAIAYKNHRPCSKPYITTVSFHAFSRAQAAAFYLQRRFELCLLQRRCEVWLCVVLGSMHIADLANAAFFVHRLSKTLSAYASANDQLYERMEKGAGGQIPKAKLSEDEINGVMR